MAVDCLNQSPAEHARHLALVEGERKAAQSYPHGLIAARRIGALAARVAATTRISTSTIWASFTTNRKCGWP